MSDPITEPIAPPAYVESSIMEMTRNIILTINNNYDDPAGRAELLRISADLNHVLARLQAVRVKREAWEATQYGPQ